jgi:hypothetical protein
VSSTRKRAVAALVAGACVALAAPARADEPLGRADEPPTSRVAEELPRATGLSLALRTGVALPVGEVFLSSGALSSTVTGYVPVRLDVGLRYRRHFYVGIAAQLARVVPADCPSGGRCSGSDARVGVMIAYHLLPTRTVDPWLGVGVGFERLNVSRALGGASVDVTARGLELLDVELGADVRATRALRLGPVLSTSIGRYSTVTVNEVTTRDFQPATHAWVMLGVRGALDL